MKNPDAENGTTPVIFDLQKGKLSKNIGDLSSDDWLEIMEFANNQYQMKLIKEEIELNDKIERYAQRMKDEEDRKHKEYVAEITSMDLPLDWNNLYSDDERTMGIHAESIPDGLILSLINLGSVDIEYISKISGYSCREVIETLRGAIYQNPDKWDNCFYKGWETSDEYLSGNLMRKYKAAKKESEAFSGYFDDNLKAIESVLPVPIPANDIYVTLGSPWIPTEIIDDFIEYLLGKVELYDVNRCSYTSYRSVYPVQYEPLTCTWSIAEKKWYKGAKSTRTYGTERMPALYIIEKTLNMKSLQIFDKVRSRKTASGEKRVLNRAETIEAQEKQQKIIKKFRKWIWSDEDRKKQLETIYEEKFSCVRRRIFDGGFLTLPGLSDSITLYPYQKNAIARILFTPNTLLAHDVGAGKTYIMIAAGMELRRMKISRKNVYVVPNNIVGQWKNIFKQMYPQANLLIIEPKNFTPKKRQDCLKIIRDGDFDAIIIAYSCFELIPMSKAYYECELENEMRKIHAALDVNGKNSRLKKRKESLGKKLSDIRKIMSENLPEICFDDLKINTLFLDEAHNFKNISIGTKIDKVLGINSAGSAKCNEMLDKVRCIQQTNGGRGVIFATGTPITNSVTDIFVMQTYLQYGELQFLELHHFDNWAMTFGEKVTEFEIDVDTSSYRMATRFSKFHNLPELTSLLAQITDFHKIDSTDTLPDFDGYDDRLISKTTELDNYLKEISARAESIREGLVDRTSDNMLKLTTDGRKAALDMRLAEPNSAFSYNSKVCRCMENILNIYKNTADKRSTQLVFSDISTPKAGFNIYSELKNLLISCGIPDDEIAFVHDYNTEKQREQLFSKMQNGDVRILLGSTFKLGMGVNVQKKLAAVHHLDVPWRPADMIQREGRILRQGNENKKIRIFRYITDGSFDAYSWQLLESKQRFICQILSGSVTERSACDVDDTVLNYAEIKALAVGNPLIKERVETANELKKFTILQNKLVDINNKMKQELLEIPGEISHTESILQKAMLDAENYAANRKDIKDIPEHKRYGAMILKALEEHIMKDERKALLSYQGFSIVLPDNMPENRRFIWIEGNGRYFLETGDSDIGCISRIDNKLNSFPDFIEKQRQELRKLTKQKSEIEEELKKEQSYSSKIEQLRKKLGDLDRKLGADKK